MLKLLDTFDTDELFRICSNAEFAIDGTGILMANGQWGGIPSWVAQALEPHLDCLYAYIGLRELKHVMVNAILPGGGSGMHVDPTPNGVRFERWHVPLKTNPKALFYYDDAWHHLEKGWWHGPVKYWERHAVCNQGEETRVHLIVDVLSIASESSAAKTF